MSSFDRVIELVNEKNNVTYALSDQTVSLVDMVPDPQSTHNTRVTMRSVPRGGYTGQVDLFYTRANLTALGTLELVQEQPFGFVEMLGIINRMKGSQVGPDDFTNTGLPAIDTGVITLLTLSAKDTSLGWIGNTQVTILIGLPAAAPDFDDFWKTQVGALFAQ
jgi:hypothetical protein